jgi:hypothetical protein
MTDYTAAGRWVIRAVWIDAAIVMAASAANGALTFHELAQPWAAGLALGIAVDVGLFAALCGDRTLHLAGVAVGWGRALRWCTALMSLALNCAVPVWQERWGVAAFHAFLPVLLIALTEYAQASGLAFHRLAEQQSAAAEAAAAQARATAEQQAEQHRRRQGELAVTLAGFATIGNAISRPPAAPPRSPRQRRDRARPAVRPAAKRPAGKQARQQTDLPTLTARARPLLAANPQMGRPTLARELGVTAYRAQLVLDVIAQEQQGLHAVERSA